MASTGGPSGWIPKVERSVERDRFEHEQMAEAYEYVIPAVRRPIRGEPGPAGPQASPDPRVRQVSGA
jgi:hypothetical protein